MKYLKQFTIIAAIAFIGEILSCIIPLPVPASVYGITIMLAALLSGAVKLRHVEETAKFHIEIMPVMFIPAAAGLIEVFDKLSELIIPFLLITVIATAAVMAVSGVVTQKAMRLKKSRREDKSDE